MEEEIIKTDKTPALLPALGILGLGIGTVALVLGIFAMKKSGDISESMSDKIEKAAALSLEIKKLSDRTDALALQIEDMKSGDGNRVGNLARQTNEAVIKLNSMIVKNRDAIKDLNKAVEKLASRPAPSRTSSQSAQTSQGVQPAQTGDQQTQASTGDEKIHIIQSGDTFAKIAIKYKTTVDALISRNSPIAACPPRVRRTQISDIYRGKPAPGLGAHRSLIFAEASLYGG